MRSWRFQALVGSFSFLLLSAGVIPSVSLWGGGLSLQVVRAEAAEGGARPELDVPYVPTPEAVVDRMLRIVKVNKSDMVYDLGCGDGRIVVTAAKQFGARGLGVDIDPDRIRESNANAKAAGVTDRVKFLQKDLFTMDMGPATVMAMYLLPEINLKLRPKMMKQLKPGTRIVSHDFDMGDWEADQVVKVEGPYRTHTLYYWVIPAQVAGNWRVSIPNSNGSATTLRLQQKFQNATGTLRAGARSLPFEAKLTGNQIAFTTTEGSGNAKVTRRYQGAVNGNTIQGTVTTQGGSSPGRRKWTARRSSAS